MNKNFIINGYCSKIKLSFIIMIVTSLHSSLAKNSDFCNFMVIAHRGASGYVPEHTLGAYALAVTMGADYIEPDLVSTSDGHLISRHSNELSTTTNVADHPEYADRRCTKNIDGTNVTGWFSEDFTLREIKTLRTKEFMPELRPGNTRMNGSFTIPTLQEIINLVKRLQWFHQRTIGIYPEIKHSTHFKKLGLAIERPLLKLLRRNGYKGRNDPVYIPSMEVSNLQEIHKMSSYKLLQLYDSKELQPYDQKLLGTGLTYGDMATPVGLQNISKYAYAVGPDKSYIIPTNARNELGTPTSFVDDAHCAGLKVHPYTFRAENYYLPTGYKNKEDSSESALGDLRGEINAFLEAGIDGLFTDDADIAARIRDSC